MLTLDGGSGLPADARPASGEPRFADGAVLAERYRVIRFLARGGNGEVYEATDLLVGGTVALKTLRDHGGASSQREAERLRREVSLARRVTHPNVCRLFDAALHDGPDGSVPILTMELLSGETLAAALRAGPFAPERARAVAEQLAAGLDAAHAAGVLHRDLKPHNVFLVADDKLAGGARAVIADFGLARSLAPGDDIAVTREGGFVGTPAYAAPEQLMGAAVSPATDVYAFGLVLYEMLTGRLPFPGATPAEQVGARLHVAPLPARRFVPELPRGWDRMLRDCLARAPARRYASAGAAMAALGAPRRNRWWALVAAPVVAVVAAITLTARPRPPVAPITRWEPDVSARLQPHDPALREPWREAQVHAILLERSAALAAARRVTAGEPDFAPAQLLVGLLAIILGDTDIGEPALARAHDLAAADPTLPASERLRIDAAVAWHAGRGQEAAARADALWAADHGIDAGLWRIHYQYELGDDERVRKALADVEPQLLDLPAPLLDIYLATVAFQVADNRTAAEAAERAAARARRGSYFGVLTVADDILMSARAQLGDYAGARAPVEERLLLSLATLDLAGVEMAYVARASLALPRDDLEGTLADLARARQPDEGLENASAQELAMRVQACGRLGDLGRAHAALAEWGRRLALHPFWTNQVGHDELAARLAELEGDLAGAEAYLTAAVALARGHVVPSTVADALVLLGRVHRERGDAVGARAALSEARSMRQILGYHGGVAEADVELLEVGGGSTGEADALAGDLDTRGARGLADRARLWAAEAALASGKRGEAALRLAPLLWPPRQGVPVAPRVLALEARVNPSAPAAARLAAAADDLEKRGLVPAALGLRLAHADVLAALGDKTGADAERTAVARRGLYPGTRPSDVPRSAP